MREIDTVFAALLSMSIRAGWLMVAVIALRLLLRSAPKWVRCVLWAFVALRLVCPFSVQSAFCLIPDTQAVSPTLGKAWENSKSRDVPGISGRMPGAEGTAGFAARDLWTSDFDGDKSPLQNMSEAAAILWLAGLLLFTGYAVIGCMRLRRSVSEAVRLRDNIYLCDNVPSPFIFGIARPAIYLPAETDGEIMHYVLAHEQAHIKRRDHWWKAISFLLLAVYWFHPLVWVSYVLFGRDLELACDEKAVQDYSLERRKSYSHALVSCSTRKKNILACPLAFGEIGVKERVKAVLRYKKPTRGALAASGVVCTAIAVCFLTNPAEAARTSHSAASPPQSPGSPAPTAQAPARTDSDAAEAKAQSTGYPAYDALLAAASKAQEQPGAADESENGLLSPEFFQNQEGRMALGYLLRDIDGDGRKELLLGANSSIEDGWDGIVWDMYTISEEAPVKVFEGWMNNTWYLCEDGLILNHSFSGASVSYDYYHYSDGTLTLLESLFFDGHDAENPSWSYNMAADPKASVPISEEAADDIIGKHAILHTQFTPFS